MSELLGHFHFLRPLWLLALGPAALAGWLLWRQLDPLHGYRASIAPHLLAHLVIRAGKTSFLRPEVVLLCVLPLSILALAGPSWRQEPSPFAEDQAAAIVVLKIAPSMQASDLQPSRLERAQHKLHDWLALRPGARVGLIAYSGSAHLVMPLTRDSRIVEQMAQALDPSVMPVQGEALADALKLAQQQLERAGVPGSIVVMTDSIAASQLSALAALSPGRRTACAGAGHGGQSTGRCRERSRHWRPQPGRLARTRDGGRQRRTAPGGPGHD